MEKNMKAIKLLVILTLSLLLIFAVVSCGNTDTDTSSNTSSDTETGDTGVNNDTSSDVSSDTDSDVEEEEEDVIVEPWQSTAGDEVISQAEALLASKHRLEYNKDGSFRVMIIADAHMNVNASSSDVERVKIRIKQMVDQIQPNLVILTGDNTISSIYEVSLRKNLNAIVSYIEEKQIPWCHVYGNHDHENALDLEKQQAIYQHARDDGKRHIHRNARRG